MSQCPATLNGEHSFRNRKMLRTRATAAEARSPQAVRHQHAGTDATGMTSRGMGDTEAVAREFPRVRHEPRT